MTRTAPVLGLALLLCTAADAQPSLRASPALTVVSTGPQGEVATLAAANEVRVVFSEPMVTLGRIPDPVRAAFFHIRPSVPGTFRWSGTTILIFTPDPKRPLPYATRYEVTIDQGAAAVSGRKLAKPVTFSFATPTVRMEEPRWYRRGGTVAGRMVIVLRFNQPVKPADIAGGITAELERHDWDPPGFTAAEQAHVAALDPQSLERFAAKVAAARAVASSSARVALRLTNEWATGRAWPSASRSALRCWTTGSPSSRSPCRRS